MLIAKAMGPPAEGQIPQKVSLGEIVWYPSLRFELVVHIYINYSLSNLHCPGSTCCSVAVEISTHP